MDNSGRAEPPSAAKPGLKNKEYGTASLGRQRNNQYDLISQFVCIAGAVMSARFERIFNRSEFPRAAMESG